VNSEATTTRQRRHSSLLLKPDLGGIDLFDWHKFDQIVALGHAHALEHRATILARFATEPPP